MNINISKSDLSRLEQQAGLVAQTLGAMANANRLLILCHLASGEKTVTQLVAAISVAQSAVSQHLSKMRAMKLVKKRRAGKQVHYSIANDGVASIMQVLYRVYCVAET